MTPDADGLERFRCGRAVHAQPGGGNRDL